MEWGHHCNIEELSSGVVWTHNLLIYKFEVMLTNLFYFHDW